MATLVTTAEVLLMPNGTTNGSTRDVILQAFVRAGPWALLAIVLIGGIGYEAHQFVSVAGPAVAEYVTASREIDEQNAENVSILTAAQQNTSIEHANMLEGITVLQSAVSQRQEEHVEQTKTLNELLQLITEATESMAGVPAQRQEQLVLLQQIKSGIEQLRDSLDASRVDAADNGP